MRRSLRRAGGARADLRRKLRRGSDRIAQKEVGSRPPCGCGVDHGELHGRWAEEQRAMAVVRDEPDEVHEHLRDGRGVSD